MNILDAAKLLGGDVIARDSVNCPGPGHSTRDRSLRVTFHGPDFTVYSNAGDDWKRCKDYVRTRLGSVSITTRSPSPADDRRKTEFALSIWHSSIDVSDTPASTYLASRGVPYKGAALRWHPFCPFGQGPKMGCLVALVRNIVTDEPQAIHRTAIDWTGRKLIHPDGDGRKALGPIKGGAVKLFDATDTLGIGEGIETTLSIRVLQRVPVWSVLNAGGVAAFPALPGVRSVFVAIDNDRSGAGEKAALAMRQTYSVSTTKINSIRTAKVGTDLNDMIMEAVGANV